MRDMTWCKFASMHNISYSTTVARVGFFHAPQPGEVCIQFTPRHISHFVSSKDVFFRSISKTFQYNTYLLTKQITVDHNDNQMNSNGSLYFLACEDNAYTIMT